MATFLALFGLYMFPLHHLKFLMHARQLLFHTLVTVNDKSLSFKYENRARLRQAHRHLACPDLVQTFLHHTQQLNSRLKM